MEKELLLKAARGGDLKAFRVIYQSNSGNNGLFLTQNVLQAARDSKKQETIKWIENRRKLELNFLRNFLMTKINFNVISSFDAASLTKI